MDPDDRRLLKKTLQLAEENNKILRKLHRAEKMRRLFRLLYWVAIIALSLGAYYLVQPYVEQLKEAYTSLKGGVESIKDVGQQLPDIGGLF
jgi:DNA helicase TIP49 (TBP-interacting protein)